MKRHTLLTACITMDGVVVVERRSGTLHYTRAFTKRFERRHPASERMNLGALFFALQNFASNSFHDGIQDAGDAHIPPIALLETAAERIVLAQSVIHQLVIVLFVRRSMDVVVAKSVVRRIAMHYDHGVSREMRLATVLSQAGKLFREACETAIRDQVDSLLRCVTADPCNGSLATIAAHFILFHYAPSVNNLSYQRACGGDDDNDEDSDEGTTTPTPDQQRNDGKDKESQLSSPSATRRHLADPPQRFLKLFASTSSVLPLAATSHSKEKVKKNAVMDHVEPPAFQSYRRLPGGDTSEPLVKILDHPQFCRALIDVLQPHVNTVAAFMLIKEVATMKPNLTEMKWRNFPLPRLSIETPGGKPVAVDVRLWKRDGCLLVYATRQDMAPQTHSNVRAQVSALFHDLEPLARCALKLSS